MKLSLTSPPGRRLHLHLFGALFTSSLLTLVLVACGIGFGAEPEETEIFKGLTVEGEFFSGGTVKVSVEYAQPYPVVVPIECDLLVEDPEPAAAPPVPATVVVPKPRTAPKGKVLDIFWEALPLNSEGGPAGEATPIFGEIVARFVAPERAGRYVVYCFTTDDSNNAISRDITIAAEATPGASR